MGDDLENQDRAFGNLLKRKFELLKELVMKATQSADSATITVVHARKLAKQAHMTYFKHLRLYDFVLKNTKLSEVKRVRIPQAFPQCGRPLGEAQVIEDKVTQIAYEPDVELMVSLSEARSSHSVQKQVQKKATQQTIEEQENQFEASESSHKIEAQSSATDATMDEELRGSKMNRKSKNVIHRNVKKWDDLIA